MNYKADDLAIDFLNDHLRYNRKILKGKNELIAKALGLNKGTKKVIDLTLGLAEDAVMLARLGCEVEGYERNAVLYTALQNALNKAQSDIAAPDWVFRLRFNKQDSIERLKEKVSADAIYIDPMFAIGKKTALPRKEMQIFRELVGADNDSDELLAAALRAGVARIVVKRSLKAEPLGINIGIKPSHSYKGSAIRYDLYLPRPGQ